MIRTVDLVIAGDGSAARAAAVERSAARPSAFSSSCVLPTRE